jgi:hypothetical protein
MRQVIKQHFASSELYCKTGYLASVIVTGILRQVVRFHIVTDRLLQRCTVKQRSSFNVSDR